jgi:predicted nucleic acid-binding protein
MAPSLAWRSSRSQRENLEHTDSLVRRGPPAAWPLELPDAADSVFLALARSSGAWLVTGNLKHFLKSARRGVTVISPADYLADLEREK